MKSAEGRTRQDELAAFKTAKRAEEEEGLNRVIRDVTAPWCTGASTVSLEGFDWEAFDRKGFGEGYNTGDRDKMMKLYSGTVATVSNSEVVKGTVVGINNRDVILNIGFKSDGLVPWLNSRTCQPEDWRSGGPLHRKSAKTPWVGWYCPAARPTREGLGICTDCPRQGRSH